MNEELIKLRNAEILPTKGFILDANKNLIFKI